MVSMADGDIVNELLCFVYNNYFGKVEESSIVTTVAGLFQEEIVKAKM